MKIQRPNGDIEYVVHPTLKHINDANFKVIQKATREAGRGEVLSRETEYKTGRVMASRAEMLAASVDRTVENAMTVNGGSK